MKEGIVRLWIEDKTVCMKVIKQRRRKKPHGDLITFLKKDDEHCCVMSSAYPQLPLYTDYIYLRGCSKSKNEDNMVAKHIYCQDKKETTKYYDRVKRSLEAAGFEVVGKEEEPHKEETK